MLDRRLGFATGLPPSINDSEAKVIYAGYYFEGTTVCVAKIRSIPDCYDGLATILRLYPNGAYFLIFAYDHPR